MFTPFKKFTNSILVCSVLAVGGCPFIPGNPRFDEPLEWQGEGGDVPAATPTPSSETGPETDGGPQSIDESDIV